MKPGADLLRSRSMLPRLQRLSHRRVRTQLAALAGLPLTYWERGATDWSRPPQGYAFDVDRTTLGSGPEVWACAKTALRTWGMYPSAPWIELDVEGAPHVGQQVMVHFRMLGLWWNSPCRIVYLLDEPNRFGFAYGTLPGHVEQGEELFLVTRDPDTGVIDYEIRMMARAEHFLAKAFPWVVGFMQRRFRRASLAAFKAYIERELPLHYRPVLPTTSSPKLQVV